jgi:prepilin peptidase CpaA
MTTWFLTAAILACLLVAAATDMARRIIPNRLVLIVLMCAIALRLSAGQGPFWPSLAAAVGVLATLGLLAAYDLVGWGDVKLITAVTFAVPAERVADLLLAIALAGGLLSCLYLALRALLRPPAEGQTGRLGGLLRREAMRIRNHEPMPYALAILGGAAHGMAGGQA